MLLYEIPPVLSPQLPPLTKISKTDSNHGIDSDWCKIAVHFLKDVDFFNLPRVFWAKKSWTLKELHHEFFRYMRYLFYEWYKDVSVGDCPMQKCQQAPPYINPETQTLLDFDSL
jgi:hypothetical protein